MTIDKITIEQEIVPFGVPLQVYMKMPSGRRIDQAPTLQLGELSDEVLEKMCQKFKEDVLRQAAFQRADKQGVGRRDG